MTAVLLVLLQTYIFLKEMNESKPGCHFGICKENQTCTSKF